MGALYQVVVATATAATAAAAAVGCGLWVGGRPCTNFFLVVFNFGALLLTVANADFENFLFNSVMVRTRACTVLRLDDSYIREIRRQLLEQRHDGMIKGIDTSCMHVQGLFQ